MTPLPDIPWHLDPAEAYVYLVKRGVDPAVAAEAAAAREGMVDVAGLPPLPPVGEPIPPERWIPEIPFDVAEWGYRVYPGPEYVTDEELEQAAAEIDLLALRTDIPRRPPPPTS